MKKKALVFDNDFETMLICAERYACGRRTYMPSLVAPYIERYMELLSENTLSVMRRDLEWSRNMSDWGDPCDQKYWEHLLVTICAEQIKRGYTYNGQTFYYGRNQWFW